MSDTLFGVTYTVISPEHPLLKKWQPLIKNWDEVAAYQEAAARKSDFERGELNKDKTGVRLDGIEVINPANGKVVPMFVSDYVLMGYGTGIVMGVPGHDQRDWDFATAFHIPHRRGGRGRRHHQGGAHAQGRYYEEHHGAQLPQRNDRQRNYPAMKQYARRTRPFPTSPSSTRPSRRLPPTSTT